MDLTPEQIEAMKRTHCDSRWELKQIAAVCDMALQTAAAQQRITQLEQALREATAVIEEDYGHGVDNGYWPTVEPLLKRLRDLDHLAAAQNERPAEESVPRGAQ